MNFIENVAAADIPEGNHFACGANAMLIQISDPKAPETDHHPATYPWIPQPKHEFKERHVFQFLDVGDDDELVEFGCTPEQAKELVRLLRHALDNRMNVVVHCMAGICRSGAVVEVGTLMGFVDPGKYRIPNTRVKRLMMEELGMTYNGIGEIYDNIQNALNDPRLWRQD